VRSEGGKKNARKAGQLESLDARQREEGASDKGLCNGGGTTPGNNGMYGQ
jgi:hypothetical protein